MVAGSGADAADSQSSSETTVSRLLAWILAGSLVTAGLAGAVVEVGAIAFPLQVGLGLGAALGGGLGAVSYLLATTEDVEDGGVETVSVSMSDEGEAGSAAETPRTDDLFAAHPDPTMYFAAEDGTVIARTANAAFEEQFGASTAMLSGTPLGETLMTVEPEPAELVDAVTAGTLDRRVTCETVDGEHDYRLRSVRLDDERTQGYLVYTDISGQKTRERDLERENERLEEFASIVSHELRNPIDSARTRVNVAQETGEDVHFEKAVENLEKMLQIIEDLLTLAREGSLSGDPVPVELDRVVDQAWEDVDAEDATLTTEDSLGTLLADGNALQQLLANVFRNSVDHGGEDVTVHVERLPDGFAIEDDGPGIPEGDREQVFEPGFSTTRSGIGLGLRIVQRIAQAHDWSVEVTDGSRLGGARIEVTGVERPGSD